MCVCVLRLLRYYDTVSCLPIVSDRAVTEGSKYFELGRQPHEFLTRNTCLLVLVFLFIITWMSSTNVLIPGIPIDVY